jgi:hypothetical protein
VSKVIVSRFNGVIQASGNREFLFMEYIGAVTTSVVFVSLFLGIAAVISLAWRYFFRE